MTPAESPRAVTYEAVSFGDLLDAELERCGWNERSRLFDKMIEATLARDDAAFETAKQAFWNTQGTPVSVNNCLEMDR